MSRSRNDGQSGDRTRPKNPKKGKDNRSNDKQHLRDLVGDDNNDYYDAHAKEQEKRDHK
jgi:hypothetical protein